MRLVGDISHAIFYEKFQNDMKCSRMFLKIFEQNKILILG